MRIFFSIGRYWPAVGGAESLVREVAWRLAASHDVSVVSLVNDNDPDFLGRLRKTLRQTSCLDGKVNVHLLRAAGLRRLLLEAYIQLACRNRSPKMEQSLFNHTFGAELDNLLKQAELVHALPAMSMSLVRLSAKLARKRQIPFVITPHLHGEEEALQMQDVLRQAGGIIAFTTVERDWISAVGIPESRIEVIGIGSVMSTLPEAGGFRSRHKISGPIVLFIGRKETYKGYRQILEAAPAVWRSQPQTCFIFAGPPTPESQRDFTAWRGERRILELPTIDAQEKFEALVDSNLLCVPSTKESFGRVFLEAWSAGKPVIGADIPVGRAVIESGEDGLLTAQEPAAIAHSIIQLLGDPQRAKEMGTKGRLKVLQRYNWESICARTVAFYERVLEERSLIECPSAVF